MLQQPMKEKLYALKLQGMIEAIERQEQDEAARELSFLDRLALIIDQQWNWRENQALTRRVKASRLRGAACVEDINYRAESLPRRLCGLLHQGRSAVPRSEPSTSRWQSWATAETLEPDQRSGYR